VQHEERPQGNSPEVFRQAGYIRVVMQKYTQLSVENRHQIKALLDAGHKESEIVRTLGVHRFTICRELKRNVADDEPPDKDYCPSTAQIADQRSHRQEPLQTPQTWSPQGQAGQQARQQGANQRPGGGKLKSKYFIYTLKSTADARYEC